MINKLGKNLGMLGGAAGLLFAAPLAAQELSAPAPADGTAAAETAEAPPPATTATIAVPSADTPAPVSTTKPTSRSRLIEEIVVTAQKREENLQDVPISVSAFSGDELDARGVGDPIALASITPGLTYNSLVGYSLIYIRGIGSDAFEPTADQSVATYLDGVYLPFAHGLAQEFVKLDRIEVLKGPQGTLFGRNATGGAINIVTRKPGDHFEASFDGGIGTYNDRSAKMFVTGPLLDSLKGSVSLLYKRADPYYHLLADSPVQHLDADVTRGVNGRLQWQPLEQLSVSLSALTTFSDGPGTIVNTVEDPKPLGAALGIKSLGPRQASIDYGPSLTTNNHLYYGQIAWTPPALDIKLLGSRQVVHTDLLYDFDSSPKPIVYFHASNQFSQVNTGELQLLSKPGGVLPDWMQATGGLYYFHSDAGYKPVIFGVGSGYNPLLLPAGFQDPVQQLLALLPVGVPVPSSGVNLTLYSTLQTEAKAAYLQTTFYLANWFDVTVGGRYQTETRGTTQADVNLTTSGNPLLLIPFGLASTTRRDFSPKLTLDFKPVEGQLFYVTGSQASKSGTYNLPAIYTPPRYVKPETVTAYEIGNKGSLLAGALRYNVAAYLNQIKDLQTQIVSLQSGGAQNLVNADKARIRGLDFDLSWQMLPETLPGFVLKASAAYIDGEYTSFPQGSGYTPGTGVFFGEGSLTLAPAQDFAGNRAVRTPKYSYNLSPNYAVDIPGGTLELGVDYSYNSGYFFDTQNTIKQPRYQLVNARVSYLYEPANLRLTVWGKNLGDENYYINRFQTDFATNSIFNPPRTFGANLSLEFK